LRDEFFHRYASLTVPNGSIQTASNGLAANIYSHSGEKRVTAVTKRRAYLLCFGIALQCNLMHSQSVEPKASISVDVYEVSLTSSATDFNGRPIEDLQASDVRIVDRGKRQKQIVRFEHRRGRPLRAGILVDTSRSMLESLDRNRLIASAFADHILRSNFDQAFVAQFDFSLRVLSGWTNKAEELDSAGKYLGEDAKSRLEGSAIFDSIYASVRDKFPLDQSADTGNFILLFYDGDDNASHANLQDIVDICQATKTAIFVFSDQERSRFDPGEKNLRELASRTGGDIFYHEDPSNVMSDLQTIESAMRNRYLLVYKPLVIRRDGSFHALKIALPKRGGIVETGSGYYAPK
jgi:Ca-activated chloride channel homolog